MSQPSKKYRLKAQARTLMSQGALADKTKALELDTELRAVLSDIDAFWVRWLAFIDGEGGGRIGDSWRKE